MLNQHLGLKNNYEEELYNKLYDEVRAKIKLTRERVDELAKENGYFERNFLVTQFIKIYTLAPYSEMKQFFNQLADSLNLEQVEMWFKSNQPDINSQNGVAGVQQPISARGSKFKPKVSRPKLDSKNSADKMMMVEHAGRNTTNFSSRIKNRNKTVPLQQSKAAEDIIVEESSNAQRNSMAHERKNHFFQDFISSSMKPKNSAKLQSLISTGLLSASQPVPRRRAAMSKDSGIKDVKPGQKFNTGVNKNGRHSQVRSASKELKATKISARLFPEKPSKQTNSRRRSIKTGHIDISMLKKRTLPPEIMSIRKVYINDMYPFKGLDDYKFQGFSDKASPVRDIKICEEGIREFIPSGEDNRTINFENFESDKKE